MEELSPKIKDRLMKAFKKAGGGRIYQEPIVKAPKIYRNEPCPCGSGKKFKFCCLK